MKRNSFIEGTIVAYIAILLTKILGAIYVIPFYRIIDESGGVLYSYAYSVYNLFLNISTSGIPTAVSIVIAEYNALKMFNEREFTYKVTTKIISIISFIAFILMFVFAKWIAIFILGSVKTENIIASVVIVIRVISFCLLIIPFLSITRGYLQGNKYVAPSSFSQLIEQIVRIFIVLVGSYITINILHLDVTFGVSVALSGTVLGGLCALIYLRKKIHKNIDKFKKGVDTSIKLKVTQNEVIKKIIIHAIPIIIVSITQNIYEMVDLKLILSGFKKIGIIGDEARAISSVIITWAPKICMVINALAMGLCTSIIPFIVSSYVEGNNSKINRHFNQAINTILFAGIPLALFIFIFSKEIYYIFYSNSFYGNIYGGNVLKVLAFLSILFCINTVMNMVLQGMKKYKIVYLNTIVGIVVNALMDIPFILLLNKLGFYPYLGTLFSTILGQFISIMIILITLKREFAFQYKKIITILFKTHLTCIPMVILMIILKSFINENARYIGILMYLGISGLLSMGLYVFVTYKTKFMEEVLGRNMLEKVFNKLKIKKN